MMRVFFAVVPPKSIRDYLAGAMSILKKGVGGHSIRWTPVADLHVTLQFIKALQQVDLVPLTERVRSQLKNVPSFQLQIGHPMVFPNPELPSIISFAVEPHTTLVTLSNVIGQAVGALGYPVESRLFQGHMTLARLHHEKIHTNVFSSLNMPIIPPILINEIYLIESKPDKNGPHYIPLAQFDLGADSPWSSP